MSSIGASTYNFIASQTVSGSSTSTVVFSNIPQTYTDLVLVIYGGLASGSDGGLSIQTGNSSANPGSVYSTTYLYGTGSSAASSRDTSQVGAHAGRMDTTTTSSTIHFLNYSNTNMYKTILSRGNDSTLVMGTVSLVRDMTAVNTIKVMTNDSASVNFSSGSTFTLYGIKAADVTSIIPTKAFGGDQIVTDGTYTYHVFKNSGVFNTSSAVTADVLVIAGGGAGSGGGGGAGGFRTALSQSLTASTSYAVTVGAGGPGQNNQGYTGGGQGGNSSLGSVLASTGGGQGGYVNNNSATAGGSGGGAGGGSVGSYGGGAGNAGSYSPVEGYAGGGNTATSPYPAGGGGGAAVAGGNGIGSQSGAGGAGTYSTLSDSVGALVNLGVLSSSHYYFAGGGGGGASNQGAAAGAGGLGGGGVGANAGSSSFVPSSSGLYNTGSGGGGNMITNVTAFGGNGGSGLVVVRYAS